MSASKEKRERAELRGSGADKKQSEKLKQERKEKKTKRITRIVSVCVVVVVVFVLLFGTNVLYKNAAAIKVGDTKFTVADYNYYYTAIYQNYYSYYSSYYQGYEEYFMPDEASLREEALAVMQNVAMLTAEAGEAGFKLSEDGQNNITTQLSYIEYYASSSNMSVDSYLAYTYGRGVDEKVFRENMEKWILSEEYTEHVRESYGYTDEELDAYYEEHKDTLDLITFRTFFISGAAREADEEKGIEAVDSENAMEEAHKTSESFIEKLNDGEAFSDIAFELAQEGSKSYYEDQDSTLLAQTRESMSSSYADWLYDATRKTGDYVSVEAEQGYYVVYFIDRDDNSYLLVNARHILIKPEALNEEDFDSDEAYQEALELTREVAASEAKDIYDQWLAGEADEESFAKLADEHSDDNSQGGLYENVRKGDMVKEFNDWCFDKGRQPGDAEIVYSEDYGYHIMYFSGYSEPCSRNTARIEYTDETYDAWASDKLKEYELKDTFMVTMADLFNVMK